MRLKRGGLPITFARRDETYRLTLAIATHRESTAGCRRLGEKSGLQLAGGASRAPGERIGGNRENKRLEKIARPRCRDSKKEWSKRGDRCGRLQANTFSAILGDPTFER